MPFSTDLTLLEAFNSLHGERSKEQECPKKQQLPSADIMADGHAYMKWIMLFSFTHYSTRSGFKRR